MMLSILTFNVQGCSIQDILDSFKDDFNEQSDQWRFETVNALQRAIDSLNQASQDWQTILNNLKEELPNEVQSTIKVEIQNLIKTTIATTGVEFRCNSDFINNRIKLHLQKIMNNFKSQFPSIFPGRKPQVNIVPTICQTTPDAIEKKHVPERVSKLTIYGYDFNHNKYLKVFLVEKFKRSTDVTKNLARNSNYVMTLNLGKNGVRLTDRSNKIVLKHGTKAISSINIIQSSKKQCETKIKTINQLEPVENFIPRHVTYIRQVT